MKRSIGALAFLAGFGMSAYAELPLKELRTTVKPIPRTMLHEGTTDPETEVITIKRGGIALIQGFEPANFVKLGSRRDVVSTVKEDFYVILHEGEHLFEATDALDRKVFCSFDASPVCLFDAGNDGEFETVFLLKQTPMALSLLLPDSFESQQLETPLPYLPVPPEDNRTADPGEAAAEFDYKTFSGPGLVVLYEWALLGGRPGFELLWVQKQRSGLREYSKRIVLDTAGPFPRTVSIGGAVLEVLSLSKGTITYRIVSGFPDEKTIELSRKFPEYK